MGKKMKKINMNSLEGFATKGPDGVPIVNDEGYMRGGKIQKLAKGVTELRKKLRDPATKDGNLNELWNALSADNKKFVCSATDEENIDAVFENILESRKKVQTDAIKISEAEEHFKSIYKKPREYPAKHAYDLAKSWTHNSIESIEAQMMTKIVEGVGELPSSKNKDSAMEQLSKLTDFPNTPSPEKDEVVSRIIEKIDDNYQKEVKAQRSILASARQHGKDRVRKTRQKRRMEFFKQYQGQAENPREALEKAVRDAQEAVIVIQKINKERDLKDNKVPKPMKSTSSREDRVDTDNPSFKKDSELTAEDAAEEKRLAEAKIKSKGQIVGIGPGARDTKSFKSMLKKKEALEGLLYLVAPNEPDITFSKLTERAEKEKPSFKGSMLSKIPGLGGKKVKIADYLKTLKDMTYGSELKAKDILEDINTTEREQEKVETEITTHTAADVADNNNRNADDRTAEEIIKSIPARDNDEKLTVAQNTLKKATEALDNHDAQQLAALIHLEQKTKEESLNDLKARAAEKLERIIPAAPEADQKQLNFLKSRLDEETFLTALKTQIQGSNQTMYLNDTGDPRKSQINSASLKSDTTNKKSESAGKMLMQSIASKSGIARGGIVEYKPGLDTSSRKIRCFSNKAVKQQEAINEGFIKEAIERKVFINHDVKDKKLKKMIERSNIAVQNRIDNPEITADQAQDSVFRSGQAPTAQASVATTDPVAPTTLATEQSGAPSRESSDLDTQAVQQAATASSNTQSAPPSISIPLDAIERDSTGNHIPRGTLHEDSVLTGKDLTDMFAAAALQQGSQQQRETPGLELGTGLGLGKT